MSDTGEWTLKRLMTEVVGSGHKSADDMTRAQAEAAMRRVLDREADPTTLGAFWLANRWKRNTPEELAAFVDTMRERCRIAAPEADPVDCGANYDGKGRTALLGVAAAAVSAAAGVPVAVHSGDRVPTQEQDAYKHVLDELGVRTDLAPGESAQMVDRTGVGFYYQPRFSPAVDGLRDRRAAMGVRTFLNTVETLANPAAASTHLGSFYHLAFAERLVDTTAASESLPFDRVVLFQGLEGYDDIRPGSTVVAEWRAGSSLDDYEIATADYGMDVEREDLAVEDVAADSAAVTEAVLAGEREGAFADAVALNAALRVYAGGGADSIEAGIDAARDAIASGDAADILAAMQTF